MQPASASARTTARRGAPMSRQSRTYEKVEPEAVSLRSLDCSTKRALPLRAMRLALVSCAILAGGVMLSGAQALAVEGERPAIDGESATNVTQTGATLEAQINPENQETSWSFQYGTNESLAGATVAPGGSIVASFGDQPVSVALTGVLASGTTYYYRVLATNATGPSEGSVRSFMTLAPQAQTTAEGPPPTPEPSIYGPPASETFTGPGNITPTPTVQPKAKPQTRAQKLTAALKACRNKKGHKQRVTCERHARQVYGPPKRRK